MSISKSIPAAGAMALAIGLAAPSLGLAQGLGGMHGPGQMGLGRGEPPSFEQLDADGDGSITVEEFKAQAQSRFAEADTNGDGVLTADEMKARAMARFEERLNEMIARMIEWRDVDGDGALSLAEMQNDNGQRMFMAIDRNKDGVISKDEFDEAARMREQRRQRERSPAFRRGGFGPGHRQGG